MFRTAFKALHLNGEFMFCAEHNDEKFVKVLCLPATFLISVHLSAFSNMCFRTFMSQGYIKSPCLYQEHNWRQVRYRYGRFLTLGHTVLMRNIVIYLAFYGYSRGNFNYL